MSIQSIVISNFVTGLETNVIPTKLSNEAFSRLENAYVFRDRVKQKDGVYTLGRLQREITLALGNTDGSGDLSVNLTALIGEPTANYKPSTFSIAIGAATFTDDGLGVLSDGGTGAGSINYASGALSISGAPVVTAAIATFTYFPGLPVLGSANSDSAVINQETLIEFDQKYAYEFFTGEFRDASFYKMTAPRNPVVWTGANYQQFFSTNYYGSLWVTNNNPGTQMRLVNAITNANPGVVTTTVNHGLVTGDRVMLIEVGGMTQVNGNIYTVTFVAANQFSIGVDTTAFGVYTTGGIVLVLTNTISGDGIRWYDGNASTLGFANFQPPLNSGLGTATTFLKGALAVLPFKDRLLFFNTFEGTAAIGNGTRFAQRCRWSQNGTPYYANSPTNYTSQLQAFYDTIPGRGGYIDCPTNESITAVALNKDVVLVWFERSFYRLVYTGNEVLPFIWQKVNDTLGVESSFSPVQFDDYVIGFGLTGIHESRTNDIRRIDTRIPSLIYTIRNADNGPERVTANIDYDEEVVYFAYPDEQADTDDSFVYNNRVLLYNYRNNTFAVLKDTFTSYGYFYVTQDLSLFWGNATDTWGDANYPWGTVQYNSGYRISIVGNQKGYVFRLVHEQVLNDPQLNITAINVSTNELTITDHGLEPNDYIYITGCLGVTGINDQTFSINVIDNDTISLNNATLTGTYLGLGEIARVDKFTIATKEFNLFTQVPVSMRINQVDFYTNTTSEGEFVCSIYEGTNSNQAVNNASVIAGTGYSMGEDSDVVVTYPNPLLLQLPQQEYMWQTLQPSVTGQSMRLLLTQDERQLTDRDVYQEQLILQAIVIYYTTSGRLIQ